MLPAEEAEELARMALVAMDSEPVAWTWHYREQWHVTNDKCRAEFVAKDGDVAVLPLYRHAQPVPVVPEEKSIPNTLSMYAVDAVAAIAEVKGWNACRAAMLQELKKVQELKRSAGVTKMCRCCTPNLRRNPIAARRKTTFLRSKTATLQRKARDGFR